MYDPPSAVDTRYQARPSPIQVGAEATPLVRGSVFGARKRSARA